MSQNLNLPDRRSSALPSAQPVPPLTPQRIERGPGCACYIICTDAENKRVSLSYAEATEAFGDEGLINIAKELNR